LGGYGFDGSVRTVLIKKNTFFMLIKKEKKNMGRRTEIKSNRKEKICQFTPLIFINKE
jgi:hypothetical protein